MIKNILKNAILVLATLSLSACEKYFTDNDGGRLSQPASISHLRRVSPSENPTFGFTAIPAVVISDNSSRNLPMGSMVVQDPSNLAAIIVDCKEAQLFKLGDYFNINLEGAVLYETDGHLVLSGLTRESFSFPEERYSVLATPIDMTLFGDEVPYVGPILASIQNPILMNVDNGVYSDEVYIEDEYGFTAELGILAGSEISSKEVKTTTPNSLVGLSFVKEERLTIYPRNIDDFIEAPPIDTLYEGFEKNTGYVNGLATFDLGTWNCTNAGARTDGGWIHREGNYAAMLVGSYNSSTAEVVDRGAMEMTFGVKNVWKVEFKASLYLSRQEFWNKNKASIKVQMSKDNGATWVDLLDEEGSADYEILWNKSDNTSDRTPEATWLQTVTRMIPNPTNDSVRFRFVNISEPIYFKDPNNNWSWGYYSSLPRIIVDGFTMFVDANKTENKHYNKNN